MGANVGLFSNVRALFVAALLSPLTVLAAEPAAIQCQFPEVQGNFNSLEDIGSTNNAVLAAWLAWAVQIRTEQFKEQLLKAPFPVRSVQMLSFRRWGDQGAVVESDDFNLILYRGTQDRADAVLDADFITVDGARYGLPGRVTHGFATGFQSLWPQVTEALLKMADGKKPLFLVGHSLGGVLAQYTAYRLHSVGFDIKAVYAFAAPVSGNADYAAAYDARLKPVTLVSSFGDDITPHVPPLTKNGADFLATVPKFLRGLSAEILRRGNYASVGRFFLHGGPNGVLEEVEDRGQVETQYWKRVESWGIRLPFLLIKNQKMITDHFIENYFCSLRSSAD